MKEQLRNELLLAINSCVSTEVLKDISIKIDSVLRDYDVQIACKEIVPYNYEIPETVQIYIVSKKIDGKSEKSLYLYSIVLKNFFFTIMKPNEEVTANDIRLYLYNYQKEHGISNRTLDCRRTIICTYFAWIAAEGYIPKNPAINIKPIKYERQHKKAMTQMDLEKIRDVCKTKREKAIVETLYSTGCRVSELEHLNISDVNFETKEVMLFGKGNKHRVSYINAKAEVALKNYLEERTDDNEALFVYDKKPYGRLKKSGIEAVVKKIINRVNDIDIHVTPHVFRHTTATNALNHGMSVVEVGKLLGHENLETTMEYISIKSDSLKSSYQKCVV